MRSYKILPAVLLAGVISMFAWTPTPAPQKKMITVPAGTTILVRMLDTVDSSKNPPGSRFTAALETNLMVGDTVVVPKGIRFTAACPKQNKPDAQPAPPSCNWN
jgi:hypothetical protein